MLGTSRFGATIFVAALLLPAVSAADVPTLQQIEGVVFVARFTCPLSNVIEAVYDLAPTITGHNKFLVVSLNDKQRYAQCRVIDEGHAFLCEASSGFYAGEPGLVLSAAQIAAIEALGFRQRAEGGNYSQTIDLAGRPDFRRIARMMLIVLRDSFGATLSDRPRIRAPGLGDNLAAVMRKSCAKVSSRQQPSLASKRSALTAQISYTSTDAE